MGKRMIVLVVLAMAVVVASASAAHAKKKLNVVNCPTGGSDYYCVGTDARDTLIGRDGMDDYIQGKAGNDVYDGKGGGDSWEDTSLTSSDTYRVSVKDFNTIGIDALTIQDKGGEKDILDLSRFYKSTDFAFSEAYIHLSMEGPGNNVIYVYDFFTSDSVDVFKFSDKTLTAQQVKDRTP
jgi:hypothetical protein